MANTVDEALTPTLTTVNSVPIRRTHWAPWQTHMTRLVPVGGQYRTGTVQCARIDDLALLAVDPTNFQSGNSVIANVPVELSHVARIGHLAQGERDLGSNLDHLTSSLLNALDSDMIEEMSLLVDAASFGAPDAEIAEASFDVTRLKTLLAATGGAPRCAILSRAALAGVSANLQLGADGLWRFPGIDAGIYEGLFTGGEGYALTASPTAIAGVFGPPPDPAAPPGELVKQTVNLPVTRIPVEVRSWLDRATRAAWVAVEVIAGFAAADVAALGWAAEPGE